MAIPQIFDRQLYRVRKVRACESFHQADFLHRLSAREILARLDLINRRFEQAIDLSGNAILAEELALNPDVAAKIGTLSAPDVDIEHLPFAQASADLIVANLSLHTVNDLPGALIQIRQTLRPDGLFLGVVYGPETLSELREVLMQAELETTDGAGMRIGPYIDVRDAGGLLQRASFALPAADADRHTVRYDQMFALFKDIKRMGETSVLHTRAPALARRTLMRAAELYAQGFSDPDGRIRATVSLVTLTGWAAHESQQKALRPGSAKMRLSEALRTIKEI